MGHGSRSVTQESDIQGEVVAVEKRHGRTRLVLQDAAERKYVLDVSEALPSPLTSQIGDLVRCHGNGTWKRTDRGWKLKNYHVDKYTLLRRTTSFDAKHELSEPRLQ